MRTNKVLGKSLKKNKKHLIKSKKSRRRRSKMNRINKNNTYNLTELYTYESPVTNKVVSLRDLDKSNSSITTNDNINNVNVVYGLKDFLAIKNKK